MLQCNMDAPLSLQLCLDDLIADLRHARRRGDLGRLALIAYCDVRRWARQAGESGVAEHSAAMFTGVPHASRDAFLEQVDSLVVELEALQARYLESAPNLMAPRPDWASGLNAPRH
jgi:hypothetical protein